MGPSVMLKRSIPAVCSLIMAGFALAGPAAPGFRVCNRAGQHVDVAFGYPDKRAGWIAQGRWSIPRGQCRRVAKEALTRRYCYLSATGSKGDVSQATGNQKGGHFCIGRKRFVFANRDYVRNGVLDCAAHKLLGR
jgi:uncharacterized membrane protein